MIGLVQAHKGHEVEADLDAEYWQAFRTYSSRRLFLLDLSIIAHPVRVQLEHKGIYSRFLRQLRRY